MAPELRKIISNSVLEILIKISLSLDLEVPSAVYHKLHLVSFLIPQGSCELPGDGDNELTILKLHYSAHETSKTLLILLLILNISILAIQETNRAMAAGIGRAAYFFPYYNTNKRE